MRKYLFRMCTRWKFLSTMNADLDETWFEARDCLRRAMDDDDCLGVGDAWYFSHERHGLRVSSVSGNGRRVGDVARRCVRLSCTVVLYSWWCTLTAFFN